MIALFGGYGLLTLPLMIISYIFGLFLLICEIVGIVVVAKWLFGRKNKKP